jgi:hypothetical protein
MRMWLETEKRSCPKGGMSKAEIADHWGKSDVYVSRILARG